MSVLTRASLLCGVLLAVTALFPATGGANSQSAMLRARAAEELYNLDRDEALKTFRQATEADPNDAASFRGLASAAWLNITLRRGNMTVDDYLGRVGRPRTTPTPPPAEAAAAFHDALERALVLARQHVASNPRDASTHYELGAAIGLRASYMATVQYSTLGTFRAAREAYEEHERVLELDPRRKDAGLIVGTYRYIVAALALRLRWMAYVSGFAGGREKGLQLVEGAASYPGDSQDDARFALILIYNREKRYDDALGQLAVLRERYPRNRLAWLESGATSLRAGRPANADRFLDEGMRRFATDTRPRMFGEDAIWYYKRGAARAALDRRVEARGDLEQALSVQGRMWVHGRAHLELGKLDAKAGNRGAANTHLQTAIRLCESDNDGATAEEARLLLK